MDDAKRKDKSLELMEKGFDQLNSYEYSKAVKTGKKLVKLRHTSGFEILGLVYAKLGKPKKAIRILEKGVQKAPDVWLLWQLLGNCYSDAQRYDEALAAYDQALQCRNADVKSLRLNRALVLSRQDQNEEALVLLRKNRGTRLVDFRTRSLEALILQDLKADARALKIVENARRKLDEMGEEFFWENRDESALIYSQFGKVFWESGQQKQQAIECAHQALELKRGEENALALLRNIGNAYSPRAKYFRLLVEGDWDDPLEDENGDTTVDGFLVTYDGVAENRKEALAILSELEPEPIRASLRIKESEVLEKRLNDPKGVYWMTIYHSFRRITKSKK